MVYLDLDCTIIVESKKYRPELVTFLNALYDNHFQVRIFSNNHCNITHNSINDYLMANKCKISLLFPNRKDFDDSRFTDILEWRRSNPHLGFVRSSDDDILLKRFSTFLIDPAELDRAILIDDDLHF